MRVLNSTQLGGGGGMAIVGGGFGAAGVLGLVLVIVFLLKPRKVHAARPSQEQELGPVVNAQVVSGTAADVPMGMPVHAAASSSSSSKPTLAEMVELLKEHCGVDGDNFSDVVHKAAHQLGIDPAGKSLMEIAMMCMQQLGLVATVG